MPVQAKEQILTLLQEQRSELRRLGVKRCGVFGSFVRNAAGEQSDVDILVVYEPGIPVGFRIFDIEAELSDVFGGRRIDMVNEKYLNPRLRKRILDEAKVQYGEG